MVYTKLKTKHEKKKKREKKMSRKIQSNRLCGVSFDYEYYTSPSGIAKRTGQFLHFKFF